MISFSAETAPQRDQSPDRLDQPEGPGALQKAVGRAQRAGCGEAEDVDAAAWLQRIKDKHGADGEKPEGGEQVHYLAAGVQTTAPFST